VQLRPMLLWEAHISQHIVLCIVHECGELGNLRPDLVGDAAPLRAGGLGCLLSERRADEGGDDAPPALSGMRQ
jgi:hypothetical protein